MRIYLKATKITPTETKILTAFQFQHMYNPVEMWWHTVTHGRSEEKTDEWSG
jgi:hypothetical protein